MCSRAVASHGLNENDKHRLDERPAAGYCRSVAASEMTRRLEDT